MPKLTFNISSTDKFNALKEWYAATYRYPAQVVVDGEVVDNPESKRRFMKRMMRQEFNKKYRDHIRNQAIAGLPDPGSLDIEDAPDNGG